MKINIEINTENAAFADNFDVQLRECLRYAGQVVIDYNGFEYPCKIRDINGNICGRITIKE